MRRLHRRKIIGDIILDRSLNFDGVVKRIGKFIENNYRRRKFKNVSNDRVSEWVSILDNVSDNDIW